MANKNKVIYWHRLGLKVYEVEANNAVLMRDIESTDITEIQEHLNFLKDNSVYLLLSDAISYLFKTEIDNTEVINEGFKSRLLEIVKADIPEDFSNFSWDYKIVNSENKKEVLVFAPIAEIQNKINQLSQNLGIKFMVIEPESISAQRDPNPIVGIVLKNDVAGKDEEVLNIVVDEKIQGNSNKFWWIVITLLSISLIALIYFLFVLNLNKN